MFGWFGKTDNGLIAADGVRRSPLWPKCRKSFLLLHPTCAACGRKDELEVHHILPFHINPAVELAESNLMTLCDGKTRSCHRTFGHLYDWTRWNPEAVQSAADFLRKVRMKFTWEQ